MWRGALRSVWLGFGELAVLAAGGWTRVCTAADLPEGSALSLAAGERGVRIARIVFAVWVIPIGLSHVVYPQADGWVRTGVASLPHGLGLPDRRRTDRERPRSAVWRMAACRRMGGGRDDQPIHAAGVGSCDSGRPEGAAAVDGILDKLGNRGGCMAGGHQHRNQGVCHGGCVIITPRSRPARGRARSSSGR